MPSYFRRARTFLPNIGFGLLFTVLLLLPDYIFQTLYRHISYATDLEFILYLLIFGTALSLSGRWLFCTITAAAFLAQLIQLIHIRYFGRPVNPVDLSKIWTEFGDIRESGAASLHEMGFIPLMLAACFALLWAIYFKYRKSFGFSAWACVVCMAFLAVYPARAMRKSMRDFLPSPSAYSILNSSRAFSFFAVKGWNIQSVKELVPEDFYRPYTVEPQAWTHALPRCIVLIVGESMSSNHMSLYSGSAGTTPNLDRMKADPHFLALPAISGAVSTHSSLGLFFNVTREPGNIWMVESQKANLFRLAKASGYETHFISAQNSLQTHAIGAAHIDDIRTVEDEAVGFALDKEFHFVTLLEKILKEGDGRKFIVFNFRAIHSPYASAYRRHPEFAVFPTGAGDATVRKRNEYKNAMRYVDAAISALWMRFRRYDDGSGIFALISDHGESLGENNLWEHTILSLTSAESPFFLYSDRLDSLPREDIENRGTVTHYEIGKMFARILGFRIINPNESDGRFYINGSHLYQDCDFMVIERDPRGKFFCRYKSVLSDLTRSGDAEPSPQPCSDRVGG